jgi:hypothetical protein
LAKPIKKSKPIGQAYKKSPRDEAARFIPKQYQTKYDTHNYDNHNIVRRGNAAVGGK